VERTKGIREKCRMQRCASPGGRHADERGREKGGMVATWSSATVVCARPRRASTRGGGHMVEALSRGAGSARAT
jgi:hypothetical protein